MYGHANVLGVGVRGSSFQHVIMSDVHAIAKTAIILVVNTMRIWMFVKIDALILFSEDNVNKHIASGTRSGSKLAAVT